MPTNKDNENAAAQTPAEYVPSADAAVSEEAPSPFATGKRRLGTGAIIGLSAAGLAVIAGAFGAGAAVATVASHNDRPAFSQMGDLAQGGKQGGQQGMRQQGDMPTDGTQKGKRGPQGQMGPNGTAPSGAPTATPAPTATN